MKGLLFLSLLVVLLAGCAPPPLSGVLLAPAFFHDGYVEGVGWVFTAHDVGSAVVLYPDTATWAEGRLWLRARPVGSEHEAWIVAFDGQWRVAPGTLNAAR